MSHDEVARSQGIRAEAYSFIVYENTNRLIYTSDVSDLNHLRDDEYGGTLITEGAHISMSHIEAFSVDRRIAKVYITHVPECGAERSGIPASFQRLEDGQIISL